MFIFPRKHKWIRQISWHYVLIEELMPLLPFLPPSIPCNGCSHNFFQHPQLNHTNPAFPSNLTAISQLLVILALGALQFLAQQIYLMAESNKKDTYSFLDKFRGKTNKVNKNGLNQALASNRTLIEQPITKDENARGQGRPIKLASLDTRNLSLNYENKASNIDDSSSNNPERRYVLPNLSKRSTDVSIRSGKLEPIPLKQIKQQTHGSLVVPPSRSTSENNSGVQRRAFGKYLKLDADAMSHFQFLLQLDQKRAERRSTVIQSER